MLDDLREEANKGNYTTESPPVKVFLPTFKEKKFLGMTAFQRFILAFLLFVIILMIGVFVLLVTQRIVIPTILLG